MKKAWKDYLDDVMDRSLKKDQSYVYPVTDIVSDTRLHKQDPEKATTEQSMVSHLLSFDWSIAIDFGCGTGAHFPLFARSARKESLLVGIDPDRARAETARNAASQHLESLESRIVCGDIETLENAPEGLMADVILCSQVLGHVSQDQTLRILRGFQSILRSDGRCGILLPVIGELFREDSAALGWDGQSDFTHLVDMNRHPGDKEYRKRVTLSEFNDSADRPTKGILPVRSFLIGDFPDPYKPRIPHRLEEAPRTIRDIVEDGFVVDDVLLYSVHRDREDIAFPIGDAAIFLRKN